jgi:hypothetical protein
MCWANLDMAPEGGVLVELSVALRASDHHIGCTIIHQRSVRKYIYKKFANPDKDFVLQPNSAKGFPRTKKFMCFTYKKISQDRYSDSFYRAIAPNRLLNANRDWEFEVSDSYNCTLYNGIDKCSKLKAPVLSKKNLGLNRT